MKKLIKYNLIALLAMVFFISSCDDDDFTGYSKLDTTSPTITVSGTGGFSLTESEVSYKFDVTLDVAQISDIALYITQTAGDATNGADYQIVNSNSRIYIPANQTTGQLEIKILRDDLIESQETFTLTIGDERTANANITPVDVTFTIDNYTSNEFGFDMAWETDVLDVIGLDLDPDEVINLRLLILNAADSSIWLAIDEVGFESFGFLTDTLADGSTLPDGDYLIATDISSTIDAGDFNGAINVDLTLDFFQPGLINHTMFTYESAFTNEFVCSSYRVYLASMTKSGINYTLDDDAFYVPYHPLAGAWQGIDSETPYSTGESHVVVVQGCDLEIRGLGFDWMTEFWGETIIAGGSIVFDVDTVAGTIDIPNQYYMTTTYDGAVQDDYNIEGSGTLDMSGEYATMVIQYEMENYGVNWGAWSYANGYLATPTFEANLTLDPDGLKAAIEGKPVKFNLKNKPVH